MEFQPTSPSPIPVDDIVPISQYPYISSIKINHHTIHYLLLILFSIFIFYIIDVNIPTYI